MKKKIHKEPQKQQCGLAQYIMNMDEYTTKITQTLLMRNKPQEGNCTIAVYLFINNRRSNQTVYNGTFFSAAQSSQSYHLTIFQT